MVEMPKHDPRKELVLKLFGGIAVWQRGKEHAPHKPLLALLALGRCVKGDGRMLPYAEVDRDLRKLLFAFGPRRNSYHTEYPFWRLQSDRIWTVTSLQPMEARKSNTDPKKSELLRYAASGGFPEWIYNLLKSDADLARRAASRILETHFPAPVHQDILRAVGI